MRGGELTCDTEHGKHHEHLAGRRSPRADRVGTRELRADAL